ncbi:MAG: hypothetical protein QOD93_1347 [Acetobacteraceae bacterium]|nr:hypothetical protein [Acetobacteraceae bacterium]
MPCSLVKYHPSHCSRRSNAPHASPASRDPKVFRDCLEFLDRRPRGLPVQPDRAFRGRIEMITDRRLPGRFDRLLHRLNLLRELRAVPSFLQHRDDAADMPPDVFQPLDDRGIRRMKFVIDGLILPWGQAYRNVAGGKPYPAPSVRLRRSSMCRTVQPARDHMNPRSTPKPSESHSRRIASAVTAPLGWTAARVVLMTVMSAAGTRQG